MTKETAVKAAQLLEQLEVCNEAISQIYERDVFNDLPKEIHKGLMDYLEKYEKTLEEELKAL